MEKDPPPTQREIARSAGVSVSTVSLALRNHPSISPATCRRIQALAAKMGYYQDAILVQAMTHMRKGSHAHEHLPLAILHGFPFPLPLKHNAHFHEFWTAAQARAHELGYYLEEFWMREPNLTSVRLRTVLQSRGIRGIIFSQPKLRADNVLDFDLEGFCAVNSGACSFTPHIHAVMSHRAQSIVQCLDRVMALGYRRVGLALPATSATAQECEAEAIFRFRVSQEPDIEAASVHQCAPCGYEPFARWVRRERPEIVLGTSEALEWLRATGLRIPAEISFAGFGISSEIDRCSGMDRRNAHQAIALVDLLVAHLHRNDMGVPAFAKSVMIDSEWVDGGTLKAMSRRIRPKTPPAPTPDSPAVEGGRKPARSGRRHQR